MYDDIEEVANELFIENIKANKYELIDNTHDNSNSFININLFYLVDY